MCLDDPEVADRGAVERVLFCSGKVYYDLRGEREKRADARTAIVRLEQLYPFPQERLKTILSGYPRLRDAVWVQEEPKNMGAWSFVKRALDGLPRGRPVAALRRPRRVAVAGDGQRGRAQARARAVPRGGVRLGERGRPKGRPYETDLEFNLVS